MPDEPVQESHQPQSLNSPPPPSQEGYTICIQVSPEGFDVDGESVPDLPTALKHIVAIVQDRPLSHDAHEEMKAGYES